MEPKWYNPLPQCALEICTSKYLFIDEESPVKDHSSELIHHDDM